MYKILVSEDSIIVNQHICKTLEGSGYDVYSAFTGKEAVRKANEHHPDLILMDIMMETKSDGIEAAVEIKHTLDIPIIFLTALTDEGTLDKVKDSQPYGYIVKPFNEVELLSNIQVAIHKSKAENEVKNNRDLFQASINSIDQAFFLFDEEDCIFYANTRAEAMLGRQYNSIVGEPANTLLPLVRRSSGEHVSMEQLRDVDTHKLFDSELVLKTKKEEIPIGDVILRQVEVKGGYFYTLFLFKDITDRVKARELEMELEKRRITSLIEGQENERSRLAREIHDGIGQMINLIKIKINALPDSPEKAELTPILEQTLDEVRNVAENLHPSRLNDFSLEKNLEKLIQQYNQDASITFSFTASDVPDLDLTKKTHLFRIVQEAISNIIKHSKAKESTIQLYGLDAKVQLTIEDDGVGYDQNAIKSGTHHGLQNIQYRVNSMNGNFTLDSNAKSGTMLLITLPV
jgi:PAS domain S-box-containing protein